MLQDLEAESRELKDKDMTEVLGVVMKQLQDHHLQVRQRVDLLDSKDWDIVVVEFLLSHLIRYVSLKWSDVPVVIHVPTVVMFPSTDGESYPVWINPT